MERLTAFQTLFSAFAISSLGGLAGLLRSNRPLSLRTAISALLYSGLTGLIIALLWYRYFSGDGNVYFLLGVSGLAGIGGTTVVDFVVQVIKKGGVNITITPGDDSPVKEEHDAQDQAQGQAPEPGDGPGDA